MMILWIFFWGHCKIGLYLGVISKHFRVFFKVKVQNWGFFLGVAKISNIFGVLEIPDIFFGEELMLGPSLRMKKKCEYPPGVTYNKLSLSTAS